MKKESKRLEFRGRVIIILVSLVLIILALVGYITHRQYGINPTIFVVVAFVITVPGVLYSGKLDVLSCEAKEHENIAGSS